MDTYPATPSRKPLIEILVVGAIVAVAFAIAAVAVRNARLEKRDAIRLANVKEIRTALELYLADFSQYPAGERLVLGQGPRALCGGNEPGWKQACADGDMAYLSYVPPAPLPADGPCSDAQNAYVYTRTSPTTYGLTFCLGAGAGDAGPGPHTADGNGVR
jgi:type II secretory pathway pseudopilin PulG